MRDHHAGAPAKETRHSRIEEALGQGVEPRGGLVEDDQARVLQEHARERDQLRLTRREPASPRAERGVQVLRQGSQPALEPELAEHVAKPPVGDIAIKERDVVAKRAAEELDVLRDEPDPFAQGREGHGTDVGTAEPDDAVRRVVQPEEQPRDRGLAGARATEQPEHLAGLDATRDVAQDRLGLVGERSVVELDRQCARWEGRTRAIRHACVHRQQLAHADDTAGGLLEGAHLANEPFERLLQHPRVAEDEVDRPERDRTRFVEPGTPEERRPGPHGEDDLDGAVEDGAGHRRCARSTETSPQACVQAAHRVRVRSAGLQIRKTDEPLLEVAAQVGGRLARRARPDAHDAAATGDEEERDRAEQREEQADMPVLAVEQGKDAEEEDRVAEHLDDEPRKEPSDRGDVAVDPFDELARRVIAVERRVEPEHVAGEVRPKRIGRAPAKVLGDVGLGDCRSLGEEGEAKEEHRDPDEPVERLAGLGAVDEDLGDLRVRQLKADAGQKRHAEQEGARPLGSEVRREQGTAGSERHVALLGCSTNSGGLAEVLQAALLRRTEGAPHVKWTSTGRDRAL